MNTPPAIRVTQSQHVSPVSSPRLGSGYISPLLSPMMSPRGEEKKRLQVFEVHVAGDNEHEAEIVVPTQLALEDFSVITQILLTTEVDVFLVEGKYGSNNVSLTHINDEGSWKKLVLSSKVKTIACFCCVFVFPPHFVYFDHSCRIRRKFLS